MNEEEPDENTHEKYSPCDGPGFEEFDIDSVDEAVNCEQRIMR